MPLLEFTSRAIRTKGVDTYPPTGVRASWYRFLVPGPLAVRGYRYKIKRRAGRVDGHLEALVVTGKNHATKRFGITQRVPGSSRILSASFSLP